MDPAVDVGDAGRYSTVYITQSTSPADTVTGFSYNDAGLVLSEQYTQGVLSGLAVTNGYDQFLRRTNVVAHQGGTILSRTTNSFDATGRLHTVEGRNLAETVREGPFAPARAAQIRPGSERRNLPNVS